MPEPVRWLSSRGPRCPPSGGVCHFDRMSVLPRKRTRICGQTDNRRQMRDSRALLKNHAVSGKRLSLDSCTLTGRAVRKSRRVASANGTFRCLSDIQAEAAFLCKVERKAAKSTAEDRLADVFSRLCGPFSGFMRTNAPRVAHKKSVSSATPSASFRKENRVFAEIQLKTANKRNGT